MRTRLLLSTLALALLYPVAPAVVRTQDAGAIRSAFTKQEVTIPMRDGVKLFTQVYAPRDQTRRYPILLLRTPYSIAPYGADQFRTSVGPSPQMAADGYIVVYQDVRGRWMSEGTFDDLRPYKPVKNGPTDIDETTDTFDTITWLLANVPNHNGRVGQWGISYPGFYTAAGMIDAQERYLTAVSRMVEDYCRGGEVPLDDEAKTKLRQEIVNAFPEHRNQIPLDISLNLIQMVGPMAFLTGRTDGATAARLPTFV